MSNPNAHVNPGVNLRDALSECRRRGWRIVKPKRVGGETLIVTPDGGRCRVNNRRKDCPRSLTSLLNKHDRAVTSKDVVVLVGA